MVRGNDLDTVQEPLLLFYLEEGLVPRKRAIYNYENPIRSSVSVWFDLCI